MHLGGLLSTQEARVAFLKYVPFLKYAKIPRQLITNKDFLKSPFPALIGREGRLLSFYLEPINIDLVLVIFRVNLFAGSQRFMLSKSSFRED